jgi:hypothetical protein
MTPEFKIHSIGQQVGSDYDIGSTAQRKNRGIIAQAELRARMRRHMLTEPAKEL